MHINFSSVTSIFSLRSSSANVSSSSRTFSLSLSYLSRGTTLRIIQYNPIRLHSNSTLLEIPLFERNDNLSESVSGEQVKEGLAGVIDALDDVFLDPERVASIRLSTKGTFVEWTRSRERSEEERGRWTDLISPLAIA